MTLERMVLSNYMIHRDMEASFDGNLIALTGEMGHGKSTFVGAIQFALTGEHPPWHREDLLTWGERKGAVVLEFSQDGVKCKVTRRLDNNDAVLVIGGEEVSGVRNVEKAMAESLGVDKDILKQIGFVQQYDIQSILFDDPSKRERSFQKLLGIGDASKIWTELGQAIQANAKPDNFDAEIERLKLMANRLENELKGISGSVGEAERALGLIPPRDSILDDLVRLKSAASVVSSAGRCSSEAKAHEEALAKVQAALAEAVAKKDAVVANMGFTLDEMREFVNGLKAKDAAAEASLASMRKLAGASDTDGKCPLCGSSVGKGQIPSHVSEELKRLESAAAGAYAEHLSANKQLSSVESKISTLDREIKDLERKASVEASLVDKAKADEAKAVSELAKTGLVGPGDDVSMVSSVMSKKVDELTVTLSRYDELSGQIARMRGEVSAKEQQLEAVRRDIESKVAEKEAHGPVAKRLDTLVKVRDWFHSSNGPRTMSLSALRAMTGYVNEYLVELGSEVKVVPDGEGFGFLFDYVDGRTVSDPLPSASKLSGGQKIELALAFRLAIYRYFGQKMGIMVLDEPTAHLSPSGIEHFGHLLQTVSRLAKNMNLQIIMPTHEVEIMPYMDSEIHFE